MEDDQQFCLRWNNHQTTLIQNFDTLLESGTLVDCTLAAEGKYLKAHKVVLSACSPYFEGLLSEHYDKHPVFILKDVKFKELKAMMDYMYRGEVNISQDQLAALLKAAESLQIKGLSESRTGGNGCSKPDTRQSKASSQSTAPSLDIPHASSGLTIEKNNKVPRQSLAQSSVGDLPEDSASPSIPKGLSSREGSQSPVSRKRKRLRRRSIGEDNSVENHESNSSDMTQANVPAMGIAPVADEKSHADPADSLGRSALMQQLTKPADEMLQLPVEKPEPTEDMIQPKSEYLDDPEESVEDLTLDDDMNDLNEMEDSNRAGPSTHDPSQHPGLAAWHVTGDRSNAGGVVGAVPGGPGNQDEVFLAAHEAVQAQRDSQGKIRAKSMTSLLAKTAKLAGLSKVRLSSAVQSEAGPSSGKKQVVYEVIHLPAVATNSARPKEAEAVNNENKDPVKKKTEEENDSSEAVKDQSQPAEIYVPQSSVEGYFKKIVHLFKFIHFNLQNIDKKLDNSEKAKPAAESNDYTILAHFIPVNNIESINHFEMLIATDRDAVSQFKKMLTQTGGRSVKDSVYRSLRKIFTNACAIQCSWQGRKNNFRVSDLSFMQIMKETFCTTFPHITEAEFETIAAEWFRFAKQRLIREESRMMSKADPLQFDQN